jgi:hypothetical protein
VTEGGREEGERREREKDSECSRSIDMNSPCRIMFKVAIISNLTLTLLKTVIAIIMIFYHSHRIPTSSPSEHTIDRIASLSHIG